jgi:reverse gyrase
MTLCENCGNEIREDRTHKIEIQGQQCLIVETNGVSRRKLAKDLYKKKN